MDAGYAPSWTNNERLPTYSLKRDVYIQTTLALFVVCLCTRLLSGYQYRKISHGRAHGVEPPTIPYWIPFLKHAFSMGWDTRRFTARALVKYGDGTPFFIDAAGKKFLVVLDPAQIKRVMSASKEADPNPFIHEMILGQMLGSPKENVEFYKNNDHMHHIQTAQIRQHVTGSPLTTLSKKVFEQLEHSIEQDYMHHGPSEWMDIPDLFLFLQNHITVAIAEALLGTLITSSYPELTADLWTFMDGANEMVMGLPRFAIPKAYAARDRLLAKLKDWSRTSDELRIAGIADPVWDPRAGSGLLQQRQELYQKTPTFDEDACVGQVLGLLFGGNSITPTITFWYLFHVLCDPSLSQQVLSELEGHYNTKTHEYDFAQLSLVPILQSLHAEISRYYSSNVAVRVITIPSFKLDDKYVIKQDTTLLIYTKFTGLFAPGWTAVRPSTTQEPLDKVWAERFLVAGENKRERFSDTGLVGSWTSFGGGEHKCPGRFFARNIGVVALAVLLGKFQCELVDVTAARDVQPDMRETAFGKMEPVRKIAARLRLRREK